MPRDNSGNFTLVSGNPVVGGTVITSDWANTTMPDIGNELSDSLDRTGSGGMLAALKHVSGSSALPAVTFSGDVNSGLYLNSVADIRMSISGGDKMRWTINGVEVFVDGDWRQILSNNKSIEYQELIAGQTIVTFVNNVLGATFSVFGLDADNGEIFETAYDPILQQLTLNESYPAGTRIYATLYGKFGA